MLEEAVCNQTTIREEDLCGKIDYSRLNPGIVIQARLNSERLPNKILLPLMGKPVLWHVINRCQRSGLPVTVASPDADPAISSICQSLDCTFRYPSFDQNDVLSRVLNSCSYHPVIRVTGDCPLIDPQLIRSVLAMYISDEPDIVSVCTGVGVQGLPVKRFPDGLDCEVVRRDVLEDISYRVREPYHREHVTSFISQNRDHYMTRLLEADHDYGDIKWSIDTWEEYQTVAALYRQVGKEVFGWREALNVRDMG